MTKVTLFAAFFACLASAPALAAGNALLDCADRSNDFQRQKICGSAFADCETAAVQSVRSYAALLDREIVNVTLLPVEANATYEVRFEVANDPFALKYSQLVEVLPGGELYCGLSRILGNGRDARE